MGWGILKTSNQVKPSPKKITASRLDSTFINATAKKGCAGCPLNDDKTLQHPKMPPTGATKASVYILGEAPGREEDEQGVQFVGASGKLLRNRIPRKMENVVRWNNTIRCRPPNNREPALLETACCRKQQEEDIAASKPKLILGFGNVPLTWFLGPKTKITAWRGRLVPVQIRGHQCWYMPIVHPAYVLRAKHGAKGGAVEELFQRDIDRAFALVAKGLPAPIIEPMVDKDQGVKLCLTGADVLAALEHAREWEHYGLDLETNAIRPFIKAPKILSCAVSDYDTTYAFGIDHPECDWSPKNPSANKRIKKALADLLFGGGTVIAHNSKFEQEWLAVEYGPKVIHEVDWQDTMAQAYILDEREGAKSLSAVSRLTLGFDVKELTPPLHMNDLESEPLSRLLPYNAYDAKYMLPIYLLQHETLEAEGLLDTYQIHNARAGPLALAQIAGLEPDTAEATRQAEHFERKIKDIEKAIQRDPDVKAYVKANGKFLPSSTKDLPGLLYHQLGFKECDVTDAADRKKGKLRLSTDEEILSKIDHPVAKAVLELRGLSKLRSTYLVPLTPGGKHIWADGKVHTSYNHSLTSTGRTSSDEPNTQNFPARKNKEVRRVITTYADHWFVATDYGQIEARVIAMASKCPVLTKALWEGYDIHGEWAQRIAAAYPRLVGGKSGLTDKVKMKVFRNEIKNTWTFPLFYGSVIESVAAGLNAPVNVLSPLYDEFWETFAAVHDWQESVRAFYRKHGYVEALTGRRRHGPLSVNEIANSPIQGGASDIVVEAGNRLSKRAYVEQRPQLQFRLNVHDDLSFYIPDATLDQDVEDIAREMVSIPAAYSSFVTVPIVVEIKVGKNWCDLEEIAKVSSVDYGHKQ